MVTFIAQGLKPNTVFYPFFNDIFVGKYCTTASAPVLDAQGRIPSASREIKTDNLGNVTGNFFIPSNTFASGAITFRLVDKKIQKDGKWVASPLYGSAEAIYESGSIQKHQQAQLTANAEYEVASVVVPSVEEYGAGSTPELNIELNPIKLCESWYFEYRLTATTATDTFIVTTNTPDEPEAAGQCGYAVAQEGSTETVTYVSSAANADGTYDHLFSFVTEDRTALFRKEWIGEAITNPLTELPTLANFRPSGLDPSIAVTVIDGVNGWKKKANVACPVNYSASAPNRTDPLAQSFYIDPTGYPQGMFVTSIGVYFKTVDHAAPVTLEIREMNNGLPSSKILPRAHVVVPGYATQASKNASVATIFRFRQPIYLKPSKDYCFVLKSSSLGYNAWTSIVGQIDVKTGKVIDAQPFSGVLFKSENNYTWVPSPLEDLKFDLYKANFDTSVTGQLTFVPKEFSVNHNTGAYSTRGAANTTTCYYSTAQVLPLSHISTVKGSKEVTINIPLHASNVGDFIFIRGVPTPSKADEYNGIRADQLNYFHQITAVPDSDHVTFTTDGVGSDLAATKTGSLQIQEVLGVLNNEPTTMPDMGTPVAGVQYINPSLNVLSVVPATTESFSQPTPPLLVSQNSFVVFTNIQVNEALIDYVGTVLPQTNVREYVKLAPDDYTSPATVEYTDREVLHTYAEPMRIAIPKNETDVHHVELGIDPEMSYPLSCKVELNLTSNSKDVSPVIDTAGLSLLLRSYRIDNQGTEFYNPDTLATGINSVDDMRDPLQNSELASNGGVALAKYKSQVVTLDKSYNQLDIFVSGTCPNPATFDVYVRTSTDTTTHADLDWTYLPSVVDEVEIFPTQASGANVVEEWYFPYTNTSKYFTVFDIKIVMRTDNSSGTPNSSSVPKIYGVRALAKTTLPVIEL